MTDTAGAPRRRARKPSSEAETISQTIDEAIESGAPSKGSAKPAGAKPVIPLFANAPDQVKDLKGIKLPDMQHGFQTIVTDLFETGFDVAAEFRAIVQALEITDALTPERMKRAANQQESIANRAHQLFIIGKVEVSAYMRETEGVYGAIREAGIQALEADKANGARTKQITDADAKSAAAALYPDEWAEICTRRDRAEAMLKQLENLAQLARSRCYTVSAMVHPGSRTI